jgi:dynein light chain LC8-type
MDKSTGSGWNCIVGKNFGAHVIHKEKKYVFIQIRELSVLLWKA